MKEYKASRKKQRKRKLPRRNDLLSNERMSRFGSEKNADEKMRRL